MTNGFHPTLSICEKCKFLQVRHSKRLVDTKFYYCMAGSTPNPYTKSNRKIKIASFRNYGTVLQHVPVECAYYLEHLLNVNSNYVRPTRPDAKS